MNKIVVVDNNPVILKLLVDFLVKQGHEVLSARDGLAALDIIETALPDIVFTDLIMPKISGEKLCKIIRSRPELSAIHLVIFSATALEDEPNISRIQADACIAKGPFNETKQHLITAIDKINNKTIAELSGKILGGANLYKRQVTSELLFSKRHYEIIFDSMPEGVIEFNFDFKIFHTNTSAIKLCEIAEDQLLASNFLHLFSGAHQERIRNLLFNISTTPAIIEDEDPILLNNRPVAINFLPIKDDEHEFLVAIIRDLTDKKRTEAELGLLRLQQERILNAAGEGIIGVDKNGKISFTNPAASEMLGWEQNELIGNTIDSALHAEQAGFVSECGFCSSLREGVTRQDTETFRRKNGSSFPVTYKSTPITENDKIIGSVLTFSDITERKKWEEKLEKTVVTDELTGLFNRRGFMTMAHQLINISIREQHDLVMIYIDFDNMKWINDQFGHGTGDQALIETAVLLQDTFRQADIVGRIGGDEFAVLCADDLPLAHEPVAITRLVSNIKRVNEQKNRAYPLSLSFGMARLSMDSPCSLEELLNRADSAMYENKERKKGKHEGGYDR
ncbi:MAG: diguanylate cyclase [Desulfobulbaceae bacterium]|nr:diguanylate cyclase [Desulfobulbaceae bacterium]